MNLKSSLFLILSLLTFNSFAEELMDRHKDVCETIIPKGFVKQGATCDVVVKKNVIKNDRFACVGLIGEGENEIPCLVVTILNNDSGVQVFRCGKDMSNPVAQDQSIASSISYKVSALITMPNGDAKVLNDSKEYSFISSQYMSIEFIRFGDVFLNSSMSFMNEEFKNVKCFK